MFNLQGRLLSIVVVACLLSLAANATGQVLIDDHFDDGDMETGGTNGGFVPVGNAQDTEVTLIEEGSIATIEMIPIANNGNKGMASISSFDASSLQEFTATFVVTEVTEKPAANGHFLGITDDGETFFRSIENFGLVFFGQESRTNSSEGFGLVINDIGSPGADYILASDLVDLDSYLDGFTASFTVSDDGWSYEITGLDDFDFNPMTFSDSGSWADAGLDDTFYTDFFDDAEHVTVSAQTNNLELIHRYDRITLQSGDAGGQTRLQPGDADQDLDFDQLDLVQVQIAAKYLTGQAATWGDGDWDAAPGGSQGNPPAGDGQFNQLDIIAALAAGVYLTGPYAAVNADGQAGDGQTSIGYDPSSGELWVDVQSGSELTSIQIESAAGIFTGEAAHHMDGSFDNDSDNDIFKATFGSSFGSFSFGNVAQRGLSEAFVREDLTVAGALAGGGGLGSVDLIYVPEPSTFVLLVFGVFLLGWSRTSERR